MPGQIAAEWHELATRFRGIRERLDLLGTRMDAEHIVDGEWTRVGGVIDASGAVTGGDPISWDLVIEPSRGTTSSRAVAETRAVQDFRDYAGAAAALAYLGTGPLSWIRWLDYLEQHLVATLSARLREGPVFARPVQADRDQDQRGDGVREVDGEDGPLLHATEVGEHDSDADSEKHEKPSIADGGAKEATRLHLVTTTIIDDVCEASASLCLLRSIDQDGARASDAIRSASDSADPTVEPTPISWTELEIQFTSELQIQARIRNQSPVFTYADLQLDDRRGGKRSAKGTPRMAWRVLRQFGERKGHLPLPIQSRHKLEKHVQLLRLVLRRLLERQGFTASDDPFICDGTSYRTKFLISCRPSYHGR